MKRLPELWCGIRKTFCGTFIEMEFTQHPIGVIFQVCMCEVCSCVFVCGVGAVCVWCVVCGMVCAVRCVMCCVWCARASGRCSPWSCCGAATAIVCVL
jgi:hypothetical protein